MLGAITDKWVCLVLAALAAGPRRYGQLRDETRLAFASYGPYDAGAVDAWLPVIALWAASWGVLGGLERPDWLAGAQRRLAWLDKRLAT